LKSISPRSAPPQGIKGHLGNKAPKTRKKKTKRRRKRRGTPQKKDVRVTKI
jgi:hypothetical protein